MENLKIHRAGKIWVWLVLAVGFTYIYEAAQISRERRSISCDEYTCNSTSSVECIPYLWVCDGHNDCAGNVDESPSFCHENRVCEQNFFKCDTMKCIPMHLVNDGFQDCDDGTDDTLT